MDGAAAVVAEVEAEVEAATASEAGDCAEAPTVHKVKQRPSSTEAVSLPAPCLFAAGDGEAAAWEAADGEARDGKVRNGEDVDGEAKSGERKLRVCMNVSFCARRAEGGGVLERGGTGLRDHREGKFRAADGSVMQPAAPPSKPAEAT
jgi:hypothetical protein